MISTRRGLNPREQVQWALYASSAHDFVFGRDGIHAVFTKDEHDAEHPEQPFPDLPYLRVLLDCLLVSGHFLSPPQAGYALDWGIPMRHLDTQYTTGMLFIEKSRQIMASWLCCAYLLWRAKFHAHQLIIIQSRNENDAVKFVYLKEPQQARISFIESRLPAWLQDGLFLDRMSFKAIRGGGPTQSMADKGHLYFPNGSHIWAVAQGGNIIRSNTPSTLFCVGPETRVLTKDLRWVEAGSVQVGDELTAFEKGSKNRQFWCSTRVLVVGRVQRPVYRLSFDDGTIVEASAQHKWLIGATQNVHWCTTEKLRVQLGQRAGSLVVRLANVWEEDRSFDGGYLAGFFDGEGYLSQQPLARGGWNTRLGVAQNEGATLHALEALLIAKGFVFTKSQAHGICQQLWIAKRTGIMEFLGKIRPSRLLQKFDPAAFGLIHALQPAKLVDREYLGEQEVVGLQTTTGTFIAEGLASHNSDEAGFQPDFGAAFQAALPALKGGGQGIFISSAEISDFSNLIEAEVA